jgi:hypothetical protein
MVWIISPAQTNSANARANCPTTSVSRRRKPPRDSPPRPPSFKDSCRGTWVARSAGAKPKSIPAAIEIPAVKSSTWEFHSNPPPACSGTKPPKRLQQVFPTHSPSNPPATESTRLSVNSCEAICQRDAPSASRTAISLRRPVERAKSKFARFEQAINKTKTDATCSTSRPLRASPA